MKYFKDLRHTKLNLLFIGLLSFLIIAPQAFGQSNTPIVKDGLIAALRSKQFNNQQIIERINARGVDFQLTPTVESELIAAGARAELIAAVRNNYRGSSKNTASKNSTNSRFTGNPLGKDAIVALLQNGVSDAQVRKNVQDRGVNFKISPAVTSEIKRAGGSNVLINLISKSYAGSGNSTPANNTARGNDYDDLIDRAVNLYDNQKDTQGALSALQQAVRLEPNNSRAYQLLGFMNLYGFTNFSEAEKNMRQAINLGGGAVFRVFHDHDGFFKDTCKGSLYVSRDGVRFESDDNRHTFNTSDANIQKVTMNNSFKQLFQTKAGSFKIVLKSEDKDGIKYSFSPLTNNAEESKMIIRLIGK